MKLVATVLICFMNCLSFPLCAEEHHIEKHHHDHVHSNEISLSSGYVYLDHEEDSAFGLHLHYLRKLRGEGIQNHFGLGIGVETIFAEHQHYNPMLSLAYFPFGHLLVAFSPGILIVEHHDEYETHSSIHIESSYGFKLEEIEIGPVIGYAQAGDDKHYSIGIHIGFVF